MIPAPELIDRALTASTADETIVIVVDTSEASLRWANNTMTTNGMSTSRRCTVIAIARRDGTARVGSITAPVATVAEIDDVVAAAVRASDDASPAEDPMPLLDATTSPERDTEPTTTDIGVFAELADHLADAFGDSGEQLFGFAQHRVHTTWLGTSTGLRRRHVTPNGQLEMSAKRTTDSGPAGAWVGRSTPDFVGIDTPALLAELSRRLDWSTNRIELPAGRYETLLPPSTVADLLIYLAWCMEGRGAQQGHTAFSAPRDGTRVGERLTDLPLTLYSDPAAAGLGTRPFLATATSDEEVSVFDNGMPIDRVDWIRDGVINRLVYPRATARHYGAEFAAPADNLLLTGGCDVGIDDMIARTERGLLLTTLWYIRMVDPATLLVTGLTRDGVYLVEQGRIVGAVNNFRFNDSPLDLLRRTTEAGRTEPTLPREWSDDFTRAAMPPLRIPDFTMSSVSRAM